MKKACMLCNYRDSWRCGDLWRFVAIRSDLLISDTASEEVFHFLFIRFSCFPSVSVSVAEIFIRTWHVRSVMTVTALVILPSEYRMVR